MPLYAATRNHVHAGEVEGNFMSAFLSLLKISCINILGMMGVMITPRVEQVVGVGCVPAPTRLKPARGPG